VHGLIRALTPGPKWALAILPLAAASTGCTGGEADDSGATDGGSTETGDIDPGPICNGDPPQGDITINSPAQFDEILGVECIPGRLIIDASAEELLDLQGLETLKEIGCLEIRYNLTLQSLNGLQNVWRIGNPDVTNCGFKVLGTKALPNLTGLDSLTYVNVPITINSNDEMTGLQGLEQLDDLTSVNIESNPKLANFDGLSGLESVGKLELISNDAVTDMTGFSNLEEVRGELNIEEHASLTSLDGFTLLQTVGSTMRLLDNPMLPTCTAQEFADGIPNKGGAAVIHGNMPDTCGD
jgi:hypothetical protein